MNPSSWLPWFLSLWLLPSYNILSLNEAFTRCLESVDLETPVFAKEKWGFDDPQSKNFKMPASHSHLPFSWQTTRRAGPADGPPKEPQGPSVYTLVIGQKSKQVYLGFWSLEDKTKATVINKGKVRASAATDTCASLP